MATKADKELALEFKQKLLTDNRWLYRAIVAIYERQTDHEKAELTTKEDNGIGFNGVDAFLMSKYAEDLAKFGRLTPNQLKWARKKMPKYALQLVKIARERGKIQ